MKKKNEIETERLILRDVSLDDIDAWYEIFNSDKVGKYLTKYVEKEKIVALIEKKINKFKNSLGSSFSVIEKKSGKVIGSLELKFDESDKSAEISYVFNDKFWGQGYATEGARSLINYAFYHLNANKILADCKENNDISIHMLENKLKMKFLKCEKDYMFDEYLNKNIGFNFYELTREDYEK